MTKRINVVMPAATNPDNRSNVEAWQRSVRDRDLDQQVAEDWLVVNEQSWLQPVDQHHNRGSDPVHALLPADSTSTGNGS